MSKEELLKDVVHEVRVPKSTSLKYEPASEPLRPGGRKRSSSRTHEVPFPTIPKCARASLPHPPFGMVPGCSALRERECEREFFIANLLVRIHVIIVMIRWTGLVPWEFEFPFPGSPHVSSRLSSRRAAIVSDK